ncbi:MAG: protein-disulfide reductase DsbD, partial [Bacteroidales bacterium]|nr:protein-disulfide reductase DsbD [Bacteroidales bacterium]
PRSYSLKTLSAWLATCLLMFAATAHALPNDGGFARGTALPGQQPAFLPVEEAYRMVPSLDEGRLSVDWLIAPGYYLYQERFTAHLEDGSALPLTFEAGRMQYDEFYQRELVVHYDLTRVMSGPLPDGAYTVRLQSQGCADAGLCYPPRDQFVRVDTAAGTVNEIDPPAAVAAGPATIQDSGGLPPLYLILLFAVLGGITLNLMPCVFPVLSIKVMSLAGNGLSTTSRHRHGLAYSLGVIASFVAIAVVLISLRAGGQALGWGFQLQSPLFITVLIYLFFVMGLWFSGLFEAGASLMNLGQASTQGSGLRHSFATGVLATVVASPCTAPFMGTALGAALTQPAPVALTIFAGLGFGMALPFLVLSWVPALAARLPRPGPWMESFKQVLAFPLYLTCVWLLWVLGRQAGSDAVTAVLVGLVLTAFAIWLLARRNILRMALAAVSLAIAVVLVVAPPGSGDESDIWEPYSQQRLDQLLSLQRPVFVNLTADWCITCLANERVALSSGAFASALEQHGITYLKGDWTNQNPEITALLNANQRNGVPLYLYYRAGENVPEILPQILTPGLVLEVLRK